MGECRCGGQIVCSTLAPKTERFVVSCVSCGSVSDIRFPKAGDDFNVGSIEETPLKLLMRLYNDKGYVITEQDVIDTPISDKVNKLHGEV